ncbi:MAG TPA: SiaC family regulatory phosphoprotein [Bacteroidales bacterium]|nr:SiaC family regulatory phosphoprotein [Bacteroidales bacterium]HPJ60838.1 SiaC family regulatory phosphoprotein [Bacteroidales bacterium]HPR13641.1 SiaC family regulatory phosphoprotein [Bacteroidales bacterium]HRW86733.1 SiaC family regulatory phosphoprotein [Bacteroidales bacterium]
MTSQNLVIEATVKTPQVDLDLNTGDLIISGKSIPENAAKIYEPVFEWVEEYIRSPRPTTNLRLNLEYFNTASSIWLAKIIKTLIKIKDPDYVLIIHLYLPIEDYEDMKELDDIKEAFAPISDIFTGAIPSIGLKVYGITGKGEVVKDTLIFI